jgi:hypothetical protein
MTSCKGCSLDKIQPHSLSSIDRVQHQNFAYDTVLRYLHCGRPQCQAKAGKATREKETRPKQQIRYIQDITIDDDCSYTDYR